MRRALGLARSILRNRTGRRDLPRLLTYVVTFACNARCVMCDSWKKDQEGDLSLAEIESIFRELPRLDAVRLTGGEPTVRRDLGEVMELARRHLDPRILHVTTNAFLPERVVALCEERVKDRELHLLVSVDGVGDKHVRVRGRPYAWDRVIETLERLAPRRKELKIRLAVNQTIVDGEGLEHYALLREVLAPLGVHNHLVMGYDASATYSTEREVDVAPTEIGAFTTFGTLDREALARTLDEVARDIETYPAPERLAKRYYLRGLRERLLEGVVRHAPPCVAMNSHLRIFPNGDVPICQFNSKRVGSLRRESFAPLWFGEEGTEARRWVRGCPGCWAECEVLPSAVYSGDILRPAALRRGRASGPELPAAVEV